MGDEQDNDTQNEDEMLRLMAEDIEGGSPAPSGEAEEETPSDEVDLGEAMLDMLQDPEGAPASEAGVPGVEDMLGPEGEPQETDAEPPPAHPAFDAGIDVPQENINRLLDVQLTIQIELGNVDKPIQEILGWAEGSLIELDKIAGEPVDVLANGRVFAMGEVVVIAENFGVRITSMNSR